MKPHDHDRRMQPVRTVLDGLSIGDAFGQQFFSPAVRELCLPKREVPMPRWPYTDDTAMALAIVEVLENHGTIDQDGLADNFARRFEAESYRAYGPGARGLLTALSRGGDWRKLSHEMFGGQGSFGNGAAMRVAPIGAYFADDIARVLEEARLSAEVTHAHHEGIAGAIAVAVATALAVDRPTIDAGTLLFEVCRYTPASAVRDGIDRAQRFAPDAWEHDVAADLGNGKRVSAGDTVPFCLWCAAAHLNNFKDAMWAAVQVGGDIDTNCAIIGGIVAAAAGDDGIPDAWRRSRESLWLRSDR